MSSNLPYKQAANVERRTWDKTRYEAQAKARIEAEENGQRQQQQQQQEEGESTQSGKKRSITETILNDENGFDQKEEFQPAEKGRSGPMHSKRAFLKARRSKIDLESKVGTSEIINPEEAAKSSVQITDGISQISGGGSGGGVGWYCKVCDCYLKDSLTYLDHINGKKHQRKLGYSMRIEKSTTEEVSSKLQELIDERKKREEQHQKESLILKEGDDDGMNEFEKIVQKKDEEILKRKEERAKRREERKKKAREEKNRKNNIYHQKDEEEDEDNAEDDAGDDTEDGIDPDMAKMMGFSSFG